MEQEFYSYLLGTKKFNRKAAPGLSNSFESFAQLWRYACPGGDLDGLFVPKLNSVQISHPGDLREYLKPKTAHLLREYADFLKRRDSIPAKNRKLMLASKLEHMTEPLVDVPVTADGALVHPLHLLESIIELDYSTRCNLEANIINEELLSRHPSLERFDTAELRSIMTKNFPLAPQQTFFNPESAGAPLSWMQGDAMDAWCATCCEENRVMKPAERKKCHGTAFVPSTALQFLTSSVDQRQARVVFYDPLSTLHKPSHVMKVFGDAIRLFGAED